MRNIIVMIILVIITIIVITLTVYELWYNWEHIIYGPNTGVPTPHRVYDTIIKMMRTENIDSSFTIIDIGCGSGKFLKKMKDLMPGNKYIGVELNQELYQKAKHVKGVCIHNIDMLNYTFKDIPTVVYFYEPLYKLPKIAAVSIYSRMFDKLRRIKAPVYVIMVSGNNRGNIYDAINSEYMKILQSVNIGSIFIRRNIKICKIENYI